MPRKGRVLLVWSVDARLVVVEEEELLLLLLLLLLLKVFYSPSSVVRWSSSSFSGDEGWHGSDVDANVREGYSSPFPPPLSLSVLPSPSPSSSSSSPSAERSDAGTTCTADREADWERWRATGMRILSQACWKKGVRGPERNKDAGTGRGDWNIHPAVEPLTHSANCGRGSSNQTSYAALCHCRMLLPKSITSL